MNRRTIAIICLFAAALFLGLVYYGWTYRWGGPGDTTVTPPPVLAMPDHAADLSLDPADFDAAVWSDLPPLTVPLLHQISMQPHATHLVPEVQVRAFRNGTDAYVLLAWDDDAESRTHDTDVFPDGVAVSFSLADEPPAESIMMGFESPMNMWLWKANRDTAFWEGEPARVSPNDHYTYIEPAAIPFMDGEVTGACEELLAARAGSLTALETTQVSGRGQWSRGRWRVIMKRPLAFGKHGEAVQFETGRIHVALAVWDGDAGDRGSRKSISDWVVLAPGGTTHTPSVAALDRRLNDGGEQEPRVINIKAKRFEYMPSQITVQKGDLITLRMESLDVTHGLYLDGYGVDIKARPGLVGKATFRADKAGRFSFRCSETCGEFHPYMIGFLRVEPNSRFRAFAVITLGACVLIGVTIGVSQRRRKEGASDE